MALQVAAGIGAAMIFATNMAILASVFPPHQRGKAMGLLTSTVYAALAAGPFFGGMLAHYFGWRSVFLLTGCTLPFVSLLALKLIRGEWAEAKGAAFDYGGSLLYALAIFGLVFGFSDLPHPAAFVWLAVGAVALVLFDRFELRQASPVLSVALFRKSRVFTLSSLSSLVSYASTAAVAFMASLYLQFVRGFDARAAGLVLISQAVLQSLVSLTAGHLADRKNPTKIATLGMAFTALGLAGLAFVDAQTSIGFIVACLGVLGVGFGLFSSPNTKVIMGSVTPKHLSAASATLGTMRLTGQAVSMGLAMMALSLTGESVEEALHITFGVCAVLCALGTYASSFRSRLNPNL
jgi:MFS family permease